MKIPRVYILLALCLPILSGCGAGQIFGPTRTITPIPYTPTPVLPSATPTPEFTPTPTITPTPNYPPQGLGPTGFPENINPLTGLPVSDPNLLNRRSVAVKVENLPRADRPQWGLSKADINYEYYTEEGTTRFISIFYGADADMVGPVRSARLFDVNIIPMYKSAFVFGSAWSLVYNRLLNQDFANRLLIESVYSAPAIFRYNSAGNNYLMTNTGLIGQVLKNYGVVNTRQNLDGMFFMAPPPAGGSKADTIYTRFSSAIFNRWDYDPVTEKYMRYSDTDNAGSPETEVYGPLVDRSTGEQITADNVVVFFVQQDVIIKTGSTEVIDVPLYGNGVAYIARNGQLYQVQWARPTRDSVLTLVNPDGTNFPYKPGNTWYEVMGRSSSVEQPKDGTWRFTFSIP
jgi:hypothetical protein